MEATLTKWANGESSMMLVHEARIELFAQYIKARFFTQLRCGIERLYKQGYIDYANYTSALSRIQMCERHVESILRNYLARRRRIRR